jgi:hypothetical protein
LTSAWACCVNRNRYAYAILPLKCNNLGCYF